MPPPPPPPAPPPIPKQLFGASSAPGKSNSEPPPDRNALLSQIRKGARLKKAETNDRSTPLIDGKKTSSNDSAKRPVDNKSNGPFPVIPPGGLFAQGIPKLRPTPRSGENSAPSSLTISSIKSGHSTSSLDHLRIGQLSGSRSQPPSPVSKPRMSSGVSSYRTVNSDTSESTSLPCGNPNFPDDINIKGPAPAPPPASQKPVFKSNTNVEQTANKPTVKRSASQTSLGQRPRLARPPPNVKPPPPPKNNAPQSAPPPPPSKPPNILRRQSFGVGESHTSRFAANKLSVANNCPPKPSGGTKNIGLPPPPPPPRNNSAPNDLNQMVTSSSPNQWTKMNIAPPPPPNRAVATSNRAAPMRPPPPRAPAPPPPPPPQHHFNSLPAPPSQLKATLSAGMAPPPPARVSSMKQTSDFEDRFMFQSAQNLPKPERYLNVQRTYPSKVNHTRQKQSTRRLPPPPPPQSGNSSQPVIHIQLNSGIFPNNFAHS